MMMSRQRWHPLILSAIAGGYLAAGAGALYVASDSSWSIAYLTMAALMSIGVLTVSLRPEPKRASLSVQLIHEPKVRAFIRSSRGKPKVLRRLGAWSDWRHWCARFTDFFRRYGVKALGILVFIAVFRISDLGHGFDGKSALYRFRVFTGDYRQCDQYIWHWNEY